MKENNLFLNSIEEYTFALHLSQVYLSENLEEKIYQHNYNYLSQKLKNIHKEKYNIFIQYCKDIYIKHKEHQIFSIYFFDLKYPILLKYIPQAPLLIFAQGNIELLSKELKLSIVGTRNPSYLSMQASKFLSNYFATKNTCMVSGMAIGIDSIIHRNSIHTVGGSIAVLAHGLNHIYPEKNYDLFLRLKEHNLLLISEYPLGQKPQRYFFPKRNRIISGLSKVLFYMEGGVKSGALITVKYALNQGREVYCLTHPYLKNNAGGEQLIEEGATSISNFVNIKVYSFKNKIPISKNTFYIGQNKWVSFSVIKENLEKKLIVDMVA